MFLIERSVRLDTTWSMLAVRSLSLSSTHGSCSEWAEVTTPAFLMILARLRSSPSSSSRRPQSLSTSASKPLCTIILQMEKGIFFQAIHSFYGTNWPIFAIEHLTLSSFNSLDNIHLSKHSRATTSNSIPVSPLGNVLVQLCFSTPSSANKVSCGI